LDSVGPQGKTNPLGKRLQIASPSKDSGPHSGAPFHTGSRDNLRPFGGPLGSQYTPLIKRPFLGHFLPYFPTFARVSTTSHFPYHRRADTPRLALTRGRIYSPLWCLNYIPVGARPHTALRVAYNSGRGPNHLRSHLSPHALSLTENPPSLLGRALYEDHPLAVSGGPLPKTGGGGGFLIFLLGFFAYIILRPVWQGAITARHPPRPTTSNSRASLRLAAYSRTHHDIRPYSPRTLPSP